MSHDLPVGQPSPKRHRGQRVPSVTFFGVNFSKLRRRVHLECFTYWTEAEIDQSRFSGGLPLLAPAWGLQMLDLCEAPAFVHAQIKRIGDFHGMSWSKIRPAS